MRMLAVRLILGSLCGSLALLPVPAESKITVEAARYLIPLLDPLKDKDEIARIERWSARLQALPRLVTPIVIPLAPSCGPSELEDRSMTVMFDADGWGLPKAWTWITTDGAWLVYLSRPDERIESALQWFGNSTFWMFWSNGYEALGALDDDHNGRLEGNELQGLALWNDANRNAVSDAGEISSLAVRSVRPVGRRAFMGRLPSCAY